MVKAQGWEESVPRADLLEGPGPTTCTCIVEHFVGVPCEAVRSCAASKSAYMVALQVALAPAKMSAQAANATAVYDLSRAGVVAANNSAAYKSTYALPFHVASTPDATKGSSSTGAAASSDSIATDAIAQGPPAASSAAGSSLGDLIQVRSMPQAALSDTLVPSQKPYCLICDTRMAMLQ